MLLGRGAAMTTAQKLSALLHDDGQTWHTDDGRLLDDWCEEEGARRESLDGHGTSVYRYTFKDDSVITVAGDAWDLGYLDCYCWQGAGHNDVCLVEREKRFREGPR